MADTPNIVLICVDAWRYDALGAAPDKHWLERYGLVSRLHTPNLDRFAGESTYFSRALATAPHTTPSHASILTGFYPPQHGVRSFFFERLPGEVATLAQILGAEGYRCLALREAEDPSQPGLLQKADLLRGFSLFHDLSGLVSAANQSISDGRPVLAFLHLWDVHAPYLYSEQAKQQGRLDAYRAHSAALAGRWRVSAPDPEYPSERAAMDFQHRIALAIGDVEERIRTLFCWYVEGVSWFDRCRWPAYEEGLRAAGLWDGTLIFVFGDHGEGVHPDGQGTHSFDHGQSLLEDVLRVPLLVRGLPAGLGQHIDEPVSLVDLVPTVLDQAGLPQRPDLPGRTLAAVAPLARRRLSEPTGEWHPGEAVAAVGPWHYAELCRGGAGFTLSHPSPEALYQCCVRGLRYKVVGHFPPVVMRRYRRWPDILERRVLGPLRRGGSPRPAGSEPRSVAPACRRWYWTDLSVDPDEQRPHAWSGRLPDGVAGLRTTCEALVRTGVSGPKIDLAAVEQSAVLDRLAALGYVEQ